MGKVALRTPSVQIQGGVSRQCLLIAEEIPRVDSPPLRLNPSVRWDVEEYLLVPICSRQPHLRDFDYYSDRLLA